MEKQIKGYEGHYNIHDDGRVFSINRGIYLKPCTTGLYAQISLCVLGKIVRKNVHRLIAEHFISGQEPGLQVNHKDGNKLNNSLDNLEWVTHKRNIQHAHEIGLYKKKEERIKVYKKSKKYTKEQIDEIKSLNQFGLSKIRIAKRYNTTYYIIAKILNK